MCQLALRFFRVRWLFLPLQARPSRLLYPVTENYNQTEVAYCTRD